MAAAATAQEFLARKTTRELCLYVQTDPEHRSIEWCDFTRVPREVCLYVQTDLQHRSFQYCDFTRVFNSDRETRV
jgi:hypothetical protein